MQSGKTLWALEAPKTFKPSDGGSCTSYTIPAFDLLVACDCDLPSANITVDATAQQQQQQDV